MLTAAKHQASPWQSQMGDVLMGRNVGTRIRSDQRDAAPCRRSSKARGSTDPRRGKRGAGQGSSTSARGLRARASLRTQGPQAPLTPRGPRSPQRPGSPQDPGAGILWLPGQLGDWEPPPALTIRGPWSPQSAVVPGSPQDPGCTRSLHAGRAGIPWLPSHPGAAGSPHSWEPVARHRP